MENYDNWKQETPEQDLLPIEHFESDNISLCLDYYKDSADAEPLEFAIQNQEAVIKKATDDIQFLIDCMATSHNVFVKNKLSIIYHNLLKNQSK